VKQLVFALIIVVNGEIQQNAKSYWQGLSRCRWYAEELTVQGTLRKYETPVHAYCVPEYVDPQKVTIYE
jgi:hypothetical protein